MKKGEIREGIVEKVKFPNKGCVRLLPAEEQKEEKAEYAEVKNVIPGQRISVRITKVRRGKGEGQQLALLALRRRRLRRPAPISEAAAAVCIFRFPMKSSLPEGETGEGAAGGSACRTGGVLDV